MAAGQWFWVIYVLCVILNGALWWPYSGESRRYAGASFIVLLLIFLLGWGIFGSPLK